MERTEKDFVYDDHGLVLLFEDPPYKFKEADYCTRVFYPDFSNSNQYCSDSGQNPGMMHDDSSNFYQHRSKKECCEVSIISCFGSPHDSDNTHFHSSVCFTRLTFGGGSRNA